MPSLSLSLVTRTGDELGNLPLEQVAILPAGSSEAGVRGELQGQMDALCAEIAAAVAEAGLTLALDALDLRIVASRALLAAGDEQTTVIVPVPVTTSDAGADSPEAPTEPSPEPGLTDDFTDLNDLFEPLQEEHS